MPGVRSPLSGLGVDHDPLWPDETLAQEGSERQERARHVAARRRDERLSAGRALAVRVRTCDNLLVNIDDLAPNERAWVLESEARWRRAHRIAGKYPGLDVGDIYHVLSTLHETPSQRVRRSLAHDRLRPRTR
jgi:hypothetical protein